MTEYERLSLHLQASTLAGLALLVAGNKAQSEEHRQAVQAWQQQVNSLLQEMVRATRRDIAQPEAKT